ncbi:hypothetical protein [Roseibium aestuarii]|uniref:Uncharacterized protein n=1 Tax=Roseibium aestuarii TaxID=2600299 RepID=A0ABW4JXC0_9HYPH|nr:hypothetical protein [Roseibium aestuarii]
MATTDRLCIFIASIIEFILNVVLLVVLWIAISPFATGIYVSWLLTWKYMGEVGERYRNPFEPRTPVADAWAFVVGGPVFFFILWFLIAEAGIIKIWSASGREDLLNQIVIYLRNMNFPSDILNNMIG